MALQEARTELELPCMLTDEEVQSRGRMLGETVSAIDDTNTERASAMKEFKERLVGLNEQQRKLARIIRNRVEDRMVGCVAQFHTPCEGMKRVIRLDTGETAREQPMTDGEKQLNLFAAQADFERFMGAQQLDLAATDPEFPEAAPPDEPEEAEGGLSE